MNDYYVTLLNNLRRNKNLFDITVIRYRPVTRPAAAEPRPAIPPRPARTLPVPGCRFTKAPPSLA